MNKRFIATWIFLCLMGAFSCVSHKKVTLVQNKTGSLTDTLYNYKYIYTLQPKDVLYISINSYNQKGTDFFNMKTSAASSDPISVGYAVSDEGYIVIPILDSLMVKGFTINQVQQQITIKMKDYISDAYVLVELGNFTVSMLGEIKAPGVKRITKEKTTMLEALALGGDFADFANRRNVKIVRTMEGKSTVAILDFTDVNIVESPYYYVMPNDVIYVEPLKAKIARSNLSQLTLGVSLISLTVVLINVFGR